VFNSYQVLIKSELNLQTNPRIRYVSRIACVRRVEVTILQLDKTQNSAKTQTRR